MKASKVYKLLINREKNKAPRSSQWYRDMNLFCTPRDLKNQQEYQYLMKTSKQLFCRNNVLEGSWNKGYIIEIIPIRSKEDFFILKFLMEDGNVVSFPFALAPGLDRNLQTFFAVLQVELVDDVIPSELFFQELLLFVSSKREGNELSYYLHDVEKLNDVIENV